MAGFILGCVGSGAYGLLLLMLTINLLGLLEMYRLFRSEFLHPQRTGGIVLGFAVIFAFFLMAGRYTDARIFLFLIPLVFIIFIRELFLRTEYPFLNIAITLLGIVCISIPLGLFLSLAFLPTSLSLYHPEIILGFFFILWSQDCGAYFVGKLLGKKPLFERVSPHKTWEGSLGGALSGFSTSYLISLWYTSYSLKIWLTIAGIILITGTLGDLIKSMMKRSLHIKDSGNILPGHGGILDRFDSLLGSASFVFAYLMLFGNA